MARKPKVPTLESVTLPLTELVANPRNARVHPEQQLTHLAASAKRFGQPKPILVRRENKMIVAGHGIAEALRRAGFTEAVVDLWDVDQETADRFMVGDNQLPKLARDDAERVKAILAGIGIVEAEALGFSQGDLDKMVKDAAADVEVVEIDTTPVEDRFWISIRGPLKDQAKALARMKEAMGDMAEVSVELGTVAVGT